MIVHSTSGTEDESVQMVKQTNSGNRERVVWFVSMAKLGHKPQPTPSTQLKFLSVLAWFIVGEV